MKRNFDLAEILKSIEVIVSGNKYEVYDKNKTDTNHNKFTIKKPETPINPETEKIIIAAEKTLKKNDSKNKIDKIKLNPLVLNSVISLDLAEPLILKKEFIE